LNTSITVPLGSANTSTSEIGWKLERQPHALRLRALAQHDRMMVDRGGEIDGIFLFGGKRQP
jgi:hypothetical protein